MAHKKLTTLYIFFYGLLVFVIYLQTLSFEYTLDDRGLIVDKLSGKINNFETLKQLFTWRYNNIDYRPVTLLSFGIENWITGTLDPRVSHGINVVLFTGILIALFFLFQKIVTDNKRNYVLWAGILIFACHPLCVEVVASVKSRDGLISMFLTTLALILLSNDWKKSNILKISFGIMLLIFASLAKIDAMGVLLFIPLYFLIKNGFNNSGFFYALKSFIILLIVFRLMFLFIDIIADPIDVENKLGFTEFTENSIVDRFNFFNRIGYLFQTNFIYIGKIFYPLNLRYYYGYAYYDLKDIGSLYTMLAIIFQIGILIFLFYKLRQQKILLLFTAGYLSFVAYALNFYTPIAGVVADRYVFMALPWVCVLTTHLIYKILFHLKKEAFFFPTIIAFILPLIFISHQRAGAWKNNLTLTENDAPYLTNSYEGMRIAAYVYRVESDSSKTPAEKKKYLLKALECAKNANKIYPSNIFMNSQEAGFHFLLQDYPSAVKSLKRASEVDSTNKDINTLLGDTYYQMRNIDLSLKYYMKAFSKDSNDYILINNIGTVLYEMGDKLRCLEFSEKLIKQDSSNLAAWENLGYYYLAEGDTSESIKIFRNAHERGLPLHMIPIRLN